MLTIPATLPNRHVSAPGVVSVPDTDVGGYDFMVGGHGFRLATDQQFAYVRGTEATTARRLDNSTEPGEQSLNPLPWLKSQSSFHAGAGQLNLEQGETTFEYQQEKVDHIRFDNSLGADVWTPGQVSRLPDCHFYNYGFTPLCSIAATVGGIDYAIVGGQGGLYQIAWLSGADAAPTVTQIDLSGSTYVSNANCTITSLTTDGAAYYGIAQMAAVGYNPQILTYLFAGNVNSTSQPEAIYRIPNLELGPTYHNLCTNPSFENDTTGWTSWTEETGEFVTGSGPTISRNVSLAKYGSASLKVVCTGQFSSSNAIGGEGAVIPMTVTPGLVYTVSAWVYVPSTNTGTGVAASILHENVFAGHTRGSNSTLLDTWQKVESTVTASGTTIYFGVGTGANTKFNAGDVFYVDGVMIQQASWSAVDFFDGSTTDTATYNYSWDGTAGDSTSKATPITVVAQTPSIVGWQKARLVGLLGRSMYELDPAAPVHSDLPDPKYTSPSPGWTWTSVAESPTAILAAGTAGNQGSILAFTLDSSGGTPVLTGGSSVAQLPVGESALAMESVLASWLAVGTTAGVRIGTFDTYTGNLRLGPLTVTTTQPVYDVASRDRFVYGSYTNQQADGKTGLVRIDLSMQVDAAGRLAYAPDLRPPTSAPTGLGNVVGVNVLPQADRIMFLTPEGIFVEGDGPGSDGDAWIRTSRIRYNTAEMKLFKLGRVHGSLDVANIQVTGIGPYGYSKNLGTFGFIQNQDPGEFRLIDGTSEWMQLQFDLQGSACILNSYLVKAYPAPKRQHIIELTANCFTNEVDRFGLEVTDPETPRQRLQNVQDLETSGQETRLVEFTNYGPIAQLVIIDQIEFKSFSRPNVEDDFGGYITFRLRTTEN